MRTSQPDPSYPKCPPLPECHRCPRGQEHPPATVWSWFRAVITCSLQAHGTLVGKAPSGWSRAQAAATLASATSTGHHGWGGGKARRPRSGSPLWSSRSSRSLRFDFTHFFSLGWIIPMPAPIAGLQGAAWRYVCVKGQEKGYHPKMLSSCGLGALQQCWGSTASGLLCHGSCHSSS